MLAVPLEIFVTSLPLPPSRAQSIFKGVVSWVASLLITVVAFHMLKFYNVERKWRRKLEGALDADREVSRPPAALGLRAAE